MLLNPSGNKAWQHHTQCHKAGADGIEGGFVLASCEIDEVEREGREAKAVAELLNTQ